MLFYYFSFLHMSPWSRGQISAVVDEMLCIGYLIFVFHKKKRVAPAAPLGVCGSLPRQPHPLFHGAGGPWMIYPELDDNQQSQFLYYSFFLFLVSYDFLLFLIISYFFLLILIISYYFLLFFNFLLGTPVDLFGPSVDLFGPSVDLCGPLWTSSESLAFSLGLSVRSTTSQPI